MPNFAANLTMMFTEWAFLDRFEAAADAGFTAVEYLFPYDFAPDAIATRLQRHGLTQAMFNLPPGNWQAGERGLAALAGRGGDVAKSIASALPYVSATGVEHLHLMSGCANREDPTAVDAYCDALKCACDRLGPVGVTLLIEPLNMRDMPGYFLNDFNFAAALIERLRLPNLMLQYDIYHRQILHGDILTSLTALMPIIGHIQTASVPHRHEPCSGELDDARIFRQIDALGYSGFVGCEYHPAKGTLPGLCWREAAR